ncbi:MAG: DUF6057 family protein [Bacteroidota bacterium]
MKIFKQDNVVGFSFLPYLVFFIFSFIYFGFFEDYIFFYQEKSSLFIFSYDFLKENLNQPGGLLIWFGKFLSTFFYYPLAGAVIVSVIITLIAIVISGIIHLSTGEKAKFLPFVIGAILFYLQTDYRFLINNNLGLLIQLSAFCLAVRYLTALRGWIPVIITPFLYFVTGGFVWLFLILITIFFALGKEKKGWTKIIVLWCLVFLTFYFSKEFLFFQTGKTLMQFPFSDLNTGSQSKLFLTVAAILSILPLIAGIRFRLPGKMKVTETLKDFITASLVGSTLVVIGVQKFDEKDNQYFHVEKLFYQNRYDEIIVYNTANPSTNYLTIFLNNIALCERDKLDDMLFNFPQSPDGKTLFLKWEMTGEVLKRGGYFYYTIGMINESHRWAFENMVMKGLSPEGLKMLIKTEIINGNYEVASKYIALLKNTLFYKKEAEAFGKLTNNTTEIIADKELEEKRQNRLTTDFFSITDNPYINIEKILSADSSSKKAFEYKLAFMLLKKNYQGIAEALLEFERFGYNRIPVNVEEAIVTYSTLNKKKLTLPGNIQINENTRLRWNQFISVFQQYNNNPKAAEPALRRQFGNTFWYYVIYK